MRGRRTFTQDLLRSVMALCMTIYPVVSIAQDVGKTRSSGNAGSGAPPAKDTVTPQPSVATPEAATRTIAQSNPTPPVPPKNGTGPSTFSVVVHLRVDGQLAGRVSLLDASGKRLPAKAHVSLIRGGKTVSAVDADEHGQFQVRGVQPGVYSVIASGPDGLAVIAVHVLPYAGDAPKEKLTLDLTLVPSNEADALSALLAQTDPLDAADSPVPEGGVVYGGDGGGYGGGGGGGGLGLIGAALGAAGLGLGIGALAAQEASPSAP